MDREAAFSYLEKNKSRFLDDLKKIISFSSVSGQDSHKKDVDACANYLVERLRQAGLSAKILNGKPGGDAPLVYAEWKGVAGAPTALVYGHYDVVGIENELLWNSDPFKAEVRDGNIYGRGTDDDKGQLLMSVIAAECLLKTTGLLPINLKFIFEGEEETESNSLERLVCDNELAGILKCDAVFASDTGWYKPDMPTIYTGLRGICDFEINIKGPSFELHSGTYGGAVANPINVLVEMLGKLWDDKLMVAIPGFYDSVAPVNEEDRKDVARLPFDKTEFCASIGVKAPRGEESYSTLERIMCRPSLDVVGIWGGYSGVGSKSAIPTNAGAKVSMRLVANQDPHDIEKLVKAYLNKIRPDSVSMDLKFFNGAYPFLMSKDAAPIKCARTAIEATFGLETILAKEGGSIPIVTLLEKNLNIPVVLCGVGWPTDKIHSDNEHLPLHQFYKGIEMYIRIFHEFAKCKT